jgi:hypothetical protein
LIFDNSTVTTKPTNDNGYGGGICLFGYDMSTQNLLLSHLFFIRCSTSKLALDVVFKGEQTKNDGYDKSNIIHCRSQSTSTNVNKLIIGANNEVGIDKSCFLPPYLSSPIYISSRNSTNYKVIDRPYCGTEYIRCRSITYGDTTIDNGQDYVIEISDGEYSEWSVRSHAEKSRNLKGTSTTGTRITVIDHSYSMFDIPISCTNSILAVSKITFILNTSHALVSIVAEGVTLDMEDVVIISKTPSTTFDENIIIFTKGCLITLNNVKIDSFNLKKPGIKINNGNGFFSNCKFQNINFITTTSGVAGEGSIFHIIIDELKTIEFTNECSFENCSVNTVDVSNGGAIYTELKEGYFYIHEKTSFKNCSTISTKNNEGKGYVFLFI